MSLLRIPFLLCLIMGYASSAVLTFNYSYLAINPCTTGCNITDPELWYDGVAPSPANPPYNDSLLIEIPSNFTLATPAMLVLTNASLFLSSVDLIGPVILVARGNTTLDVFNASVRTGALLVPQEGGQVVSHNETRLIEGGRIEVQSFSAFAQEGRFFFQDLNSSISVKDFGYIGLHSYSELHGFLDVAADALFTSTAPLVFTTRNFEFINVPTIYDLNVVTSQLTLQRGLKTSVGAVNVSLSINASLYIFPDSTIPPVNLSVDSSSFLFVGGVQNFTITGTAESILSGTLSFSTSNVYLTRNLNVPLILGGQVNLTADSLVIKNLTFQNGVRGEFPQININAQVLHFFDSPLQFPGNLYTNYAYLPGSLNISGGIYAREALDVFGNLTATSIEVEGSFVVTNGTISAQHVAIFNSLRLRMDGYLELVQSTLSASNLVIGASSSLSVFDSIVQGSVYLTNSSLLEVQHGVFEGNINSEGTVRISKNRTLTIIGNYTQSPQGLLEIRDLDLANRTSGYVNATGGVQLNGKIAYSILYEPRTEHEVQMLVVLAPAGITGKFTEKSNFGLIQKDAEIEYAPNSISLLFNKQVGGGKKSLWWIWLVVAFGIIAAIGLVGLLYLTRHRRKGFRQVPM